LCYDAFMDRSKLLDYLLDKFSITADQLEQHRLFYNGHFDEYGNEVYEDIKTRLVHLQNFWDESFWLNQRYDLLFKKYKGFDQIIELGFSLPYVQLRAEEQREDIRGIKFLLVDYYDSAIRVTREILCYLSIENVQLLKADIQSSAGWDEIKDRLVEGRRLFVAIETVEHLKKSDDFWEHIGRFAGDKIILSLPIGPAIPSHELVMKNDQEALGYIGRYVDIEEKQFIYPATARGEGADEYRLLIVYGTIK